MFWQLITGISKQILRFNASIVHIRLVENEAALGHVFLRIQQDYTHPPPPPPTHTILHDNPQRWVSQNFTVLLSQSRDTSCYVNIRIVAPPPPWLEKHNDLRAHDFAQRLQLWHQSRLANVNCALSWILCGINTAALWFVPVSIIPSMLQAHLFIHLSPTLYNLCDLKRR